MARAKEKSDLAKKSRTHAGATAGKPLRAGLAAKGPKSGLKSSTTKYSGMKSSGLKTPKRISDNAAPEEVSANAKSVKKNQAMNLSDMAIEAELDAQLEMDLAGNMDQDLDSDADTDAPLSEASFEDLESTQDALGGPEADESEVDANGGVLRRRSGRSAAASASAMSMATKRKGSSNGAGASAHDTEPSEVEENWSEDTSFEDVKAKSSAQERKTAASEESENESEENENNESETDDNLAGFRTYEQRQAEESERKKVQIEFPYSSLIREKVPKVFQVAETVAEEWVNDGDFEKVPVGHPLAQITVAAGLRKAKEVEKKLEEKGVFAMAKMGLEYAKSQLNEKMKKK